MTLIFKSLMRTVWRKPLQPIILILTLSLAVAITVFTLAMHGSMLDETAETQTAEYGTADITVKLDGGSRSRFLFAKRAEELLPEGTRAVGLFDLPLVTLDGETTVLATAAEFSDIGEIFSLSFTDYLAPTESEVSDAIFISREFSDRMSLSLGDTFEVSAFGGEKIYTVYGISPTVFLGRYDVLADISGVVEIITADSAVLSALGQDFKPAGSVYIDLPADVDPILALEKLKSDSDFSDKSIETVAGIMKLQANEASLSVLIKVSLSLSALLAGAVVFSCLYVLSAERREVNGILASAGADPRILHLTQYVEVTVYHIIASMLGVPLSIPLISLLQEYSGFVYSPPALTEGIALRGVLLTFFVAMLTVTIFVFSPSPTQSVKRGKCERPILTLLVLLMAVLSAACAFILPVKLAILFYVISTAFLVAFIFLGVPFIIVRIVALFDRLLNNKEGHVSLKYALKNLMALKVSHNTSRLVALLVGVLLSISALFFSAMGFTGTADGLFPSELAVMNATDRCYEAVDKLECVEGAYRVHMSSAALFDEDVFLISADDKNALAEYVNMDSLPTGNQAIISSGEATKYSVSVGDSVSIRLGDRDMSFVVSGITDAGIGVVIFDADHFGISPNLLLVSGSEDVGEAELIRDVTAAVKEELAPVIETSELFRGRMRNVQLYLRSCLIIIIVLVVFALIGLADNLSESHRSRQTERELYITAGVSKRDVKRMRAIELFFVFSIGTVIGIIAAMFATAVLSRGTLSFGYELIINLKRLF